MPCDIGQESMLEQAEKFVECPNSQVQDWKRDAYALAQLQSIGASLSLEQWTNIAITYVGSTNNIDEVVYTLTDGSTVTLTFTYVGGVPSADDALIATVAKS